MENKLDFLLITMKGTLQSQYKRVLDDLVNDAIICGESMKIKINKLTKIKINKLTKTKLEEDEATLILIEEEVIDEIADEVVYFVNKYSFFITYFEEKEEYEKCAEIKKHLLVLIQIFNFDKDVAVELITDSINIYKLDYE